MSTMLDRLEAIASDRHLVAVYQMLEAVSRRSFGPLLLLPGLVVPSPVGGMPGVPTFVAWLVGTAAAQLIIGRRYIWLPRWLLKRKAPQAHLHRAIRFIRPFATYSEKLARPRLRGLTVSYGTRVVAFFCLCTCLLMPPLEIVPFANAMCGAALSLFGLAMIARDGVLTCIALAASIGATAALAMTLFQRHEGGDRPIPISAAHQPVDGFRRMMPVLPPRFPRRNRLSHVR